MVKNRKFLLTIGRHFENYLAWSKSFAINDEIYIFGFAIIADVDSVFRFFFLFLEWETLKRFLPIAFGMHGSSHSPTIHFVRDHARLFSFNAGLAGSGWPTY